MGMTPSHENAKHEVGLDDLTGLRDIDELALSPDSEWLVYSTAAIRELWMMPVHASGHATNIGAGFYPMWSPDSRQLAYYSNRSGTVQLWVMDRETGGTRQVTHFDKGIDPDPTTEFCGKCLYAYSWSPDSKRLVFPSRVLVPANGEIIPQPDVVNGTPLVLTATTPPKWTLAGVFAHGGYGVSRYDTKTGRWMAGLNSDLPSVELRETQQLFVVSLADQLVTQITHDELGYFNPDWSPDGRFIVCASAQGVTLGYASGATNIYVIDLARGSMVGITHSSSSKWMPKWAPSGKRVAYLSKEGFGDSHFVFTVAVDAGSAPANIATQLNRTVLGFQWLEDGQAMAIQYVDGVSVRIGKVEPLSGKVRLLGDADIAPYPTFSATAKGAIVWQESGPYAYGAIRYSVLGKKISRRVVDLNPQIAEWELGQQETVVWSNSRGDKMQGVLIKPVGFSNTTKYPLIVDGYPLQQNTFKGSPMFGNQAWASMGYLVFWPNPRAPHVPVAYFKSDEFNHAARVADGWDVTMDDVMSGVDELVHRGIVDPDRIGLYGFSNGGAVVDYLVTKSGRFRCAVSVAGALLDWIRPELLEPFEWVTNYEIDGTNPYTAPDVYVGLSTVLHANAVSTPMLLAVGDEDGDFLLDMIEMYNGLRRFGGRVTLLRYPGQGHGFSGAALTDFWNREATFFDQCLRPSASAH